MARKFTVGQLARFAARIEQIDESGDALLVRFLEDLFPDQITHSPDDDKMTLRGTLEAYLIWAAGPGWYPWIETAQVGDLAPK